MVFTNFRAVQCINTIYMEIFKGRKICGFWCKFTERKILILEKKQWLNEINDSQEN